MDYATYVAHVRGDGDRLVSVAGRDPSAEIPSCPGWTMHDLVTHVAQVYEHKIACTELGHAPDPWPPAWRKDRDDVVWLADAHARLLSMFGEHEPTDPSATWWPADQTVGFWARRMAHETAVHRVDAELAAGRVTPVDGELALDGIDEVLTIMLAGDWSEAPDGSTGQRVAIEAGGRGWIVTLEPNEVGVAEEARAADAAIGGDPSDVLLWLWGRAADERVSRSGPEATTGLLRSRLKQATQ
jgi:uncharacterized protein (TIGR03083 family)